MERNLGTSVMGDSTADTGGKLRAWAPSKSPDDRVFIDVNANVGV